MKVGIRFPHSTQEKRANQDKIWNRPGRNPCNLVDVNDDIWRFSERCWKSFRKTQYKVKK